MRAAKSGAVLVEWSRMSLRSSGLLLVVQFSFATEERMSVSGRTRMGNQGVAGNTISNGRTNSGARMRDVPAATSATAKPVCRSNVSSAIAFLQGIDRLHVSEDLALPAAGSGSV
jgi:hypothetical protein